MFLLCRANRIFPAALLVGLTALGASAQQPSPPDSASAADTSARKQAKKISLDVEVAAADTIPHDFFEIVDNLGLHSYTIRLLSRLDTIPDELVLTALARSNMETDHLRANAFTVMEAVRLLCQRDSLWNDFFHDLDIQLKEPNIIRFNFRDNQKWKSYALNELFYSNAFQELMLIMGNLGIADSKDGRQWLSGWPQDLRWKYREYQIEYIPEDQNIKVREFSSQPGEESPPAGSSTRLQPASPVLAPQVADSVEPPYEVPNL